MQVENYKKGILRGALDGGWAQAVSSPIPSFFTSRITKITSRVG